jgi:hypothetical protein
VLGEASCIQRLGDIAQKGGDRDTAQERYGEALALYTRVANSYGIGKTHQRLAQVTDGVERAGHIAAAREAWLSIQQADLVAKFLDPLG